MSMNRSDPRADNNQKAIVDYMRRRGAVVWRTKRPFDLCVGWGGQLHWVEVKSAKGKLNANQMEDRDLCVANGLSFGVVRSVEGARTLLDNVLADAPRGDEHQHRPEGGDRPGKGRGEGGEP